MLGPFVSVCRAGVGVARCEGSNAAQRFSAAGKSEIYFPFVDEAEQGWSL